MKSEQDANPLSAMKDYEELEYLSLEDTESVSSSKKNGLNLRPVWRLLRRNIFLIGGITTVVAGVTSYLVLSQPITYEGEFQLLVEPVTATGKLVDPSVLSRSEPIPISEGLDYSTLIQVLESPSVLSGIIKPIQAQYPKLSQIRLRQLLTVERVNADDSDQGQLTKLIRVTYKSQDFQQIIFVLEEVAKGYLKFSLEDRKTRIGGGVAFIEEQLPELRQRVNTLEGKLQGLQQQYRLSDPDSEGAELAKQAREVETQRLETQKELRGQKTLYASLEKQLGLAPNEAIAASSLSEDPRYQALLSQLKQVETQIAAESARFTEENPVIQDLRAQQKNLKSLLSQETRKIVGSSLAAGGNSAQVPQFQNSIQRSLTQQLIDTLNEIQVLELRNQATTQTVAAIDKQLREFPAIKRRYKELERQLEIATTTLNQLLLRRETLRVEAAQKEIPWRIVSKPQIRRDQRGQPVLPEQNRTKKLALGVIGGFLLGLGIVLIKEKRQNIFHSVDDLKDETKLPLLGTLPFSEAAKTLEANGSKDEMRDDLSLTSNPKRTFLRASDDLYTNIRFLASETPIRSLVVSSVSSRDGKTTVAMHLAQAAASMGQRVLLVDANMSLPQLHSRLGLPNFEGLNDILSKNLDPHRLIQRSPYHSNLFVLTSGPTLPGSGKLLASNQMQYLMEQLQNLFDLVIYDTAHLKGHSDANFLSLNANGLLLVFGIAKTSRSQAIKMLQALQTSQLPILGMVANFAGETVSSNREDDFDEDDDLEPDMFEDEFDIFRVGSQN